MAAKIKKDEMERICWQLPADKIEGKISLYLQAYAPNHRKDPDNLYTLFTKFFLDSLVLKGIIENDGQKQIGRIVFEPVLIGEERMIVTITQDAA